MSREKVYRELLIGKRGRKLKLYTVGHYNHTQEQFVTMLESCSIDCVVDIRALPGSNRSPHFNKDQIERWLHDAGITYVHLEKLGGRRKLSSQIGERLNAGWENRSFHNYADYTLTDLFKQGRESLLSLMKEHCCVIMCSERHPSRCHRLIISNDLTVKGYEVIHLIPNRDGKSEQVLHELGKWGAIPVVEKDETVVYPELN